MNKIKIKGKTYKVNYTIRALFLMELMTGKPFAINTLLDNYIFFYALILANNENPIDWDDFIDALDSDPNIYKQINDIVNKTAKLNELTETEETDEKGNTTKKK